MGDDAAEAAASPPAPRRVGLGCMRLSTDGERDDARAHATIAAAVAAGISVFDTARAYHRPGDAADGPGGRSAADGGATPGPPGNEALLAAALRACHGAAGARIVTKGGMARPDGAWVPDGRARTIRADCEASLTALDGLPIELYLLHAPDPRTAWRTSVRALGRLLEDGLVRRIGLSNVNRAQLDEALALVPVSAVELSMSLLDDSALRSGLLAHCERAGIAVLAHGPLGGPRRAARLAQHPTLVEVAARHGCRPAEVALAWLLSLGPSVIALPGARRPDTARSAAAAAAIALTEGDRQTIATAFGVADGRPPAQPRRGASTPAGARGRDVVLLMGIPGAGKTRAGEAYRRAGAHWLNRDERGGSLRAVAAELDRLLDAGAGPRLVLDNTYLTRAARSRVIEVAHRHGAAIRCTWLDTPLVEAQRNLVERLLERFDGLPTPEQLRAAGRREAGLLDPLAQLRAHRMLEPPDADEGFDEIERIPFVRAAPRAAGAPAVLVAAGALARPGFAPALADLPAERVHLLFDWRVEGEGPSPQDEAAALAALGRSSVVVARCPHGGGPPRCWCRPPLPGLALAFARREGVDLARSVLIGTGAAHAALARALATPYRSV